jgi:hypothetical protein
MHLVHIPNLDSYGTPTAWLFCQEGHQDQPDNCARSTKKTEACSMIVLSRLSMGKNCVACRRPKLNEVCSCGRRFYLECQLPVNLCGSDRAVEVLLADRGAARVSAVWLQPDDDMDARGIFIGR